jgi:hypothetical protein
LKRSGLAAALGLALCAFVPASRAEDAFVRCDRSAALEERGSFAADALDKNGFFLDDARQYVAGSRYRMTYLYFTVDAAPADVLAAYTSFERHAAAFSDSVSEARVTARALDKLTVFFEEKMPFAFVPKPRFSLTATLTPLPQGGRVDLSLDSAEDNSSRPLWYDAFLRAAPYKGKTLVLYCKYVVPADKRMPGYANNLVRDRILAMPARLRDLVRSLRR